MSIYQGAPLSKPKTQKAAASRVKRGLAQSVDEVLLKRTPKQEVAFKYNKKQAEMLKIERPSVNIYRDAQVAIKQHKKEMTVL